MMIDWNSPPLLYGLLTIFFLLLHLVLFVLAKSAGKRFDMKFSLFFAAAFYLMRLMELEKDNTSFFDGGGAFIFIVPAVFLALIGIGELLVNLIYRIFRIDKKLEEQAGKSPTMDCAPNPSGQHSPLFSDRWNRLIK